jgi:hypothetical protein
MGPHDDLGGGAAEILDQSVQSFDHVLVAEVPRLDAAFEHGAIVALGIFDEASILLGHEEGVRVDLAIASGQFAGTFLHLYKLADHFLFTTLG